jgi:glycosyltransferase involved in cell wall biosynthesis
MLETGPSRLFPTQAMILQKTIAFRGELGYSSGAMRLLFVADGRSPIALNWIEYFLNQGHEVHLASTFQSPVDQRLASYTFIPVAFSSMKPANESGKASQKTGGMWRASAVQLRTRLRQWLGPLTLPGAGRQLRTLVDRLQPDLIHAMRIPYEGMVAALAGGGPPLVISVWGNDFTLHAPSTPFMARYTRLALQRAAALHADCQRDVRLAYQWGFPSTGRTMTLPGAGGVQPEIFYPPETIVADPVVVQPRGVRAYVNNRAFFQAIPRVLEVLPSAQFLCPSMQGEAQAEGWVKELGISDQVILLPKQTRAQMAELFRQARMVVSPTTHDGTPNTLLEAMACGCLPVAGDLESLREWITPGVNGLLVDLGQPEALAEAILTGLKEDSLCWQGRKENLRQIAERAVYGRVMPAAEQVYRELIAKSQKKYGIGAEKPGAA